MRQDFTITTFGKRFRSLRKARGYSQESFALAANIDRTYIGGIERGERNPSLKTILQLAEVLEVEPADLFMTGSDHVSVQL